MTPLDPNAIAIIAGSSSVNFTESVCAALGLTRSAGITKIFTEGNTYVQVLETVRGKNVYLIQSIALDPNNEFVEILFWLDALKRASAASVTLIMPYFGYAKGDKKDEPRVSIRARVCAECLELAGADRIVTMDLHAPQIQGFFKRSVDHLFAYPMLCDYLTTLDLTDFTVVSPDSGFIKDARKYAKRLDLPMAIACKERLDHTENPNFLEIIGKVTGRNILVVDDFCISGNTLMNLAEALVEKGAKRIIACTSHLLLSEAGVKQLENSPIEMLVTTDTIHNPYAVYSQKIKIVQTAHLFAKVIHSIEKKESVSVFFDGSTS